VPWWHGPFGGVPPVSIQETRTRKEETSGFHTDNGYIVQYRHCKVFTEGYDGLTVVKYNNGAEWRGDHRQGMPDIAHDAIQLADERGPDDHASLMDCVRFDEIIGLNQTC
jgi:hypothetical protein